MENLTCELNTDKFDKAVNGGLDDKPVLREGCGLSIYIKPEATERGRPAVVITFTVELPDKSLARAQCVTTAALLETVVRTIQGWRAGGHLMPRGN